MFIFAAGKGFNSSAEQDFPHHWEDIDAIVAQYDESRDILKPLFHGQAPADDKVLGAKYENLYGFDRIYIYRPGGIFERDKGHLETEVYLSHKHLVLYSQDAVLREMVSTRLANQERPYTAADVLRSIFAHMFSDDMNQLHQIEDGLAALEMEVIENSNKIADITKRLLDVRKTLLILNRYYTAMFDMLEDLEENLNTIFTREEITHFRIYTNKANRLLDEISHLQEYATQVREAYQSQLDIQQNKVMQFFTVITAIFFPLTLIAGWYGMNLKMPEYGSAVSYPVLIAVSIVTVTGLLIYFKKKKWF